MRKIGQLRRSVWALATAMLAGLLLAGCGLETDRVGAGALVGPTRVPIDAVQQQLDAVLDRVGPRAQQVLTQRDQIDDVTRSILTLEIQHILITIAAQRQNLSVPDRAVNRFVEQRGGAEAASRRTVFTPEGFRQRARDLLLLEQLGREYLTGLTVTVNYITERTREAALQRARQLARASPERARRIIKNQIEQGAAAALDQKLIAARNPQLATSPAFGVPEGTVVAFPSSRRLGAWLVMVVTQRSTSSAAAADADLDDVQPATLRAVGLRRLALLGLKLGIRVNPRYGVWDPVAVGVAPSESQLAGFVAPPTGPRAT